MTLLGNVEIWIQTIATIAAILFPTLALILKFPNEKNQNYTTNFKGNKTDHWKISDKSNTDQLKAITGFCFTVGILTIVGLYSNLM